MIYNPIQLIGACDHNLVDIDHNIHRPHKFMTPYCIMYIAYSDKSRIVIALGFLMTNGIADTYMYLYGESEALLQSCT